MLVLLLAPLLPLAGMWVFSTWLSVTAAANLLDAQTNAEDAGLPASQIVFELQHERKFSSQLVSGDATVGEDLKRQRELTDVAVTEQRRLAEGDALRESASQTTLTNMAELLKSLEGLPTLRASVDTGRFSRLQAVNAYNEMIDKAFDLYSTVVSVDDHTLAQAATTTIALTEAREQYAREDALVSGVLAGGGTYAPGERGLVVKTIGTQRHLYEIARRTLTAEDRATYERIIKSEPYLRLRAAEDKIVDAAKPAVDAKQWNADFAALNTDLGHLEERVAHRAIEAAGPAATRIILRLALAGVLGLLVIVALVLLAIRIARGIIRRITALRQEALEVAERKLPDVVARLRAGEQVDVDAEVPPLTPADDELSQLGGAFAQVQRTAIGSAVQEATLRAGLNQVFLNLGRRSQVLVHRQLSLLDQMERRVTDPRDLEELYRIDHLSTRLRRHSEDLVILAGSVPGRGWRNPVPLHDVLRSAVSEVEEYTRVTLIPLPELALLGRAVSDVVHLIAELLENATAFSPRDTHVQMSGQLVPNGFAVEIEDRGVGMPPEQIEDANRRLADPPDFDPAHSSRLGLFVVARLAARHGIKVTLRSSPYGGITAVALLPRELVVEERSAQGELTAAPPAAVRPLALTGTPTAEHPTVTAVATLPPPAPATVEAVIPAQRPAVAPAPPAAPAVPAPPEQSPTLLSPEGLPMRQRQANLSPHLRTTAGSATAAVPQPPADETATRAARGPETMRSMLSSLQQGTYRGREAAAQQRSETTDENPQEQ
ncbi:MAG: hypothetical protein HOV79_15965 [Hamadaea sp.]|nr:hypothetical protein [Hamadaea sp.]